MFEGDLPQARKNLEQSLQIRTEIDETSNAVETRLQLATLSIEEGHAADAERVAREARDEYRTEGRLDDEIGADIVLLKALRAENKSAEATKEASSAELLVAKSQDVPNRLAIKIVNAQIQAASGEQSKAIQSLSTTARDAAKYGFAIDQLEARLAHGDIELNSGRTASARAELATLKTDAARRGFGLIAHKAAALLSKNPS